MLICISELDIPRLCMHSNSVCLDRAIPAAEWLERWYDKPETLGPIPGWDTQKTFFDDDFFRR